MLHALLLLPPRLSRTSTRHGPILDLLDSFDQEQRDHVVVPDRVRSRRDGMNDEKRVSPDPGGVRINDIKLCATGQVEPEWHEGLSIQFLLDVLAGHT